MNHKQYVPILFGRAAEFAALSDVTDEKLARVTPLVVVPALPWDYEEDVPSKSHQEHLRAVASKLAANWPDERPFLVDLHRDLWSSVVDRTHVLSIFLNELRTRFKHGIPTTGIGRPDSYQDAVRAEAGAQGVCIRVDLNSYDGSDTVFTGLTALLARLGVERRNVDLVVDAGHITLAQNPLLITVRAFLSALPNIGDWRSLILAGTAFPQNLSNLDAGITTLQRTEWILWTSFVHGRRERIPSFGDYSIAHPEPTELDPRIMKMTANIRYTTDRAWLIAKGQNVRDYGYDQYRALCAELSRRPEFSGAEHCEGDRTILECANNRGGVGNATTWRRVGTTHHLTFVVDQIANLAGL